MYKIPFHRKVLPWLFTIIFLIMAPAVVFYTSGYRWNPKKKAIERNGTLIIDTIPTGASIKLNGKNIPETTSVTLQNMSPGSYNIELNLENYYPWSKTLWIEPERVTFISEVILWPKLEPEFLGQENTTNIFSDADSGSSLVATNLNQKTSISILDYKTSNLIKTIKSNDDILITEVNWNPYNTNQAIIYGFVSSTLNSWFVDFEKQIINKIPQANYHWQSKDLIGYANSYKLTIHNDQSVSREAESNILVDELNDFQIMESPQSSGLILTKGANAEEGFILPNGSWSFWNIVNDVIILRNQNNWLWIDTGQNPSVISQASGDWLLPVTVKRKYKYAYKNFNEAWVWDQDNKDLIYRQSEPLVSLAWHPEGRDLMIATKQEVTMFNLDTRDGRYKTVLADFDEIKSATIIQDSIFVVGQKNDQKGLWKIPLVAKKTNSFLPLSSLDL